MVAAMRIRSALVVIALAATACGSNSVPGASTGASDVPSAPATGTTPLPGGAAAEPSRFAFPPASDEGIEPTGPTIPILDPPRPGVYRYRVDVRSPGDLLRRIEFDIREPERGNEGWRQWLFVHEAGDPNGAEQLKRWGRGQVLFEEVVFHEEGDERRCKVVPPIVELVFPLEVGATWTTESSGSCPGLEPGSLDYDVLGTEEIVFEGETYLTFVIETTTHGTFGGQPYEYARRAWFSPELRVNLRQEAGTGSTPSRLLTLIEIVPR